MLLHLLAIGSQFGGARNGNKKVIAKDLRIRVLQADFGVLRYFANFWSVGIGEEIRCSVVIHVLVVAHGATHAVASSVDGGEHRKVDTLHIFRNLL